MGQVVWGPLSDSRLWSGYPSLCSQRVAVTTQSFSRSPPGSSRELEVPLAGSSSPQSFATSWKWPRHALMVMMVFIPAAPILHVLGQTVILAGTWRWLFAVLLSAEPHRAGRGPPSDCQWLRAGERRWSAAGFMLVLSNRVTLGYGIALRLHPRLSCCYIASAQQVFGSGYGLGKLFPFAFGSVGCAIALLLPSRMLASSGASACAGCRIRRWPHIAALAVCWHCPERSAVALLAGARRNGGCR